MIRLFWIMRPEPPIPIRSVLFWHFDLMFHFPFLLVQSLKFNSSPLPSYRSPSHFSGVMFSFRCVVKETLVLTSFDPKTLSSSRWTISREFVWRFDSCVAHSCFVLFHYTGAPTSPIFRQTYPNQSPRVLNDDFHTCLMSATYTFLGRWCKSSWLLLQLNCIHL